MASIEVKASTRKKTKESIRVEQLIPSQLRESSADLIKLLEAYYEFMNSHDEATYELARITTERDVDQAGDKYINLILKEIAQTVPRINKTTRSWLLKNLIEFYKIRGSNESIKQFFNILYSDNAEVYYPGEDMLIPSSGNWDPDVRKPVIDDQGNLVADTYTYGQYLDDGGHPSSTKKIQDSFFYQKYSYVIRTGQNVGVWENGFRRMIHPAGFKFFGEIALLIELLENELADYSNRAKMPFEQPGFLGPEDFPVIIIALGLATLDVEVAKTYLEQLIHIPFNTEYKKTMRRRWLKATHFYDSTPIHEFADWSIEQLLDEQGPLWNVGTYVTPGAGSGPYDQYFFDDDTITFDTESLTFDIGSYGAV